MRPESRKRMRSQPRAPRSACGSCVYSLPEVDERRLAANPHLNARGEGRFTAGAGLLQNVSQLSWGLRRLTWRLRCAYTRLTCAQSLVTHVPALCIDRSREA